MMRRGKPSFSTAEEERETAWAQIRSAIPYVVAVAAFFTWVNTACLPPGRTLLVNYGAVIVFGICVTAIVQRRFGTTTIRSRVIGWGGMAMIVGLFIIWSRYDFYTERNTLEGGGFIDFYMRRGSHHAFYKYIDNGTILEGPCSASGKPHGKWKQIIWVPFSHNELYYWYGEEISEGEWHLRNK
jgi:hypothetical protein